MTRLLFVRNDSIGDNILFSSILEPISNHFNAKVDLICQEHIGELYNNSPFINKCYKADFKRLIQDEVYYKDFIGKFSQSKYDIIFNTLFSSQDITDKIILSINADFRIRMRGDTHNSSQLFVEKVYPLYSKVIDDIKPFENELRKYEKFLDAISVPHETLEPAVWLSKKEINFAEKVFSESNFNAKRTLIFFPGVQFKIREYYKYTDVLKLFCQKNDFAIIGVGSNNDREMINEIFSHLECKTLNLAGKTSILQTAALIKKSAIAFGAETSNAHIACAVGTKNVILLGGGHFGRFMPYSSLTTSVVLPLQCFGCDWKCKIDYNKCIVDINPNILSDALQFSLEKKSKKINIYLQSSNKNDKNYLNMLADESNYEFIFGNENEKTENNSILTGTNDKTKPKVSAIVSTYNSEKFIKGCLEDLLEQTLYKKGELEIVVVNSGSQQGEDKIIQEYIANNENIVYIKTERETLYAAWNRGIKAASGEYITNANTDDGHKIDAFEVLADELDKNTDIDLVYGYTKITDKPFHKFDDCINFRPLKPSPYDRKATLLHFQFGPQPMWRKSVHDKIGLFDSQLKAVGDYDFNIRFSLAGLKAKLVSEYLTIFLDNQQSITNSFKDQGIEKQNLFLKYRTEENILKLYSDSGLSPKEIFDHQGLLALSYNVPGSVKRGIDINYASACSIIASKFENKLKISFIAQNNNFGFAIDLIKDFQKRFNIYIVNSLNQESIKLAYNWSDVLWLEWLDVLAIQILKLPKRSRIIVRLHAYEAFKDYLEQADFTKIDYIIFLALNVKEYVIKKIPAIQTQTNCIQISGGLDLNKFKFVKRDHGYNIAFVGALTQTKNIALALQIIKFLSLKDSRYHLHIFGDYDADAGVISPEIPRSYMTHLINEMNLSNNVTIYGYVNNIDFADYFKSMNYILSTSYREGLTYNISEAMAMGIKPLIHNWPGAKRNYPEKFVFNYVAEVEQMVINDYDSPEYREYVEANHDQTIAFELMSNLVKGGEANEYGYLSDRANSEVKVSIAYFVFWEDITSSGIIKNQVFPLLKFLSLSGYRPILFSLKRPNFNYDPVRLSEITKKLNNWGITLEIIEADFDIKKVADRLTPLILKYNIKLIHCRSYIAARFATLIKRELNIPFIFDMRGLMPEEGKLQREETNQVSAEDSIKIYLAEKYNEKVLLEEADVSLVLNNSFKETVLKSSNAKVKRIEIIQNFVDLNSFYLSKSHRIRMRNEGRYRGKHIFIFSGASSPWYDFEKLFIWAKQIIETVPNSLFIILTYTDSSLKVEKNNEFFERLFAKYSITSDYFLFTNSESEDVTYWLSIADIGIICYKQFYKDIISPAQPIKYAEYLATGLPIIASNLNHEINSVLGSNNNAGWIVEADILSDQVLKSITEYLLLDEENKSHIRVENREIAYKLYNFPDVAGKYLKVYKTLIPEVAPEISEKKPIRISNLQETNDYKSESKNEKRNKLKISFIYQSKGSACPAIRIQSPISSLIQNELIEYISPYDSSKFKDIKSLLEPINILSASQLRSADIIIIQRELGNKVPFTELKEILKGTDTKIVYEIDDNLLNIPPKHSDFQALSLLKNDILEYLQNADMITVTTDNLKKLFSVHNENVVVLPNQIDERIWGNQTVKKSNSKIRILFSGTVTHHEDLEVAEDALLKILDEFGENIEFYYWGNITNRLLKKSNVYKASEFIPLYSEYAKKLKELNIDIGIIPLVDNEFNRTKSNIKWLEYSICKIASVMSDVPAYNLSVKNGIDGLLVSNNYEEWYSNIRSLIVNDELRNRIAENSFNEVSSNYLLSKNYNIWYEAYSNLIINKKNTQISIIIPVLNKFELTRNCIESIMSQNYDKLDYEIIVIDNASIDATRDYFERLTSNDQRIKYIRNDSNYGFAKSNNIGVKYASGEYITFLNNDTKPHNGWLTELLKTFREEESAGIVGAKLLYPDGTIQHAGVFIVDDKIMNLKINPWHRGYRQNDSPEFNKIEKFQAVTAACLMIKKDIYEKAGGFDESYWNGYEDVDLCFKVQKLGYNIFYQPKCEVIHYESKSGEERFIKEKENYLLLNSKWADKIIPDKVRRRKLNPDGSYHDILESNKRLVSIIIPVLNKWEYTSKCLDSIRKNTDKNLYEIIIVDNGSVDNTQEGLKNYQDLNIKIITNKVNLGFSKANNQGAELSSSTFLLFLNNDTEPQIGWLSAMLEVFSQEKGTGIVGSKLFYPDGTIQHAGVLVYNDDFTKSPIQAIHNFYQLKDMPEANVLRRYPAVTGACLMIRRELFSLLGGFSEEYWNGFEDVDLCLKVLTLGYDIYYQPKSVVIHHESKSGPERLAKARENLDKLIKNWQHRYTPEIIRIGENDFEKYDYASIIVVTYNSGKSIEACLKSVKKYLRKNDEVIIVDNASSDSTVNICEKIKANDDRIKIISSVKNLGFTKANNLGIKESKNPFIVFLNPDTVVTNNWLEKLLHHFDNFKVGAVGPISDYANATQYYETHQKHAIQDVSDYENITELFYKWYERGSITAKLLIGFCFVTRRDIINQIGMLDEDLFLGNDDLEFSWRLRLNGFRLKIALDTFIHHDGQVSFATQKKTATDKLVEESTEALYKKLVNYYGEGNVPTPEELWHITWFAPKNGKFNPDKKIEDAIIKGNITAGSPSTEVKTKSEKGNALVSIVVPLYNQLKYTKEFLASVKKFTKHPYELIFVDNNSSDKTAEFLTKEAEKNSNIKLLINKENVGFPGAVNRGIKSAEGSYVLIANNDIVVTEHWLEKMVKIIESDHKTGIVGPISNSVSGFQIDKEAKYKNIPEMHKYAKKSSEKNKGKNFEFPRVAFLCTLIKKNVIDEIGGLDERFAPGNFEDDDFCLRAQLAGYKTIIAKEVFIHHYGSKSFTAEGVERYNERLKINRKIFVDKWGSDPDGIWIRNEKINNRTKEYPMNEDRVLELFERIMINIKDEDNEEALRLSKIALEEYEKNPSRNVDRNKLIELISILEIKTKGDDEADFVEILNEGFEYFNSGEFELALEKFDLVEKNYLNSLEGSSIMNPEDLFILKGASNLSLKNYSVAEKEFSKILNINPESSKAYEGLGEANYLMNKLAESLAFFESAEKLSPDNENVRNKINLIKQKVS